MPAHLPPEWQLTFDVLEGKQPLAALTPMMQDLQQARPFIATLKRQYAKLADCGADLDVVTHLFLVLTTFACKDWPELRWLARQELPDIKYLEDTIADVGFQALPTELQTGLHARLIDLRTTQDSLIELIGIVTADNPLLRLLARAQPICRGRGRPSAAVPTLFMVLLTDHLRERTGRPHYHEIGRVTYHLFRGRILKAVINKPNTLVPAVQDRCKKFRRTNDVAALRTAILSTETPFLKHT